MAGKSLRFDGKVVLITGAGGGLGREYALAFGARGASVVVNDLGGDAKGEGRGTSLADKVVAEIRAAGGKAVANYESVENGEKLVNQAIKAFGRIDILINNAGILRDRSFGNMTTLDWDLVHRVHLRGAFLVTKAAWPHMKKQGYGRIIMTCSTTGVFGNFGQANYAAAKIGLHGLCKTLAIEGDRYNIKCNTIVPVAASRLTVGVLPGEVLKVVEPKLVAPFLVYLCHESCDDNSGLFFIAGGAAAQIRWQQSKGVHLLSDDGDITPEKVRDNWAQVKDWTSVTYPANSHEGTASLLSRDVLSPSESEPPSQDEYSYTFKDVIQYALGVGVSVKDDGSHLKFLYEGHDDFSVLPTFAVIPAQMSMYSGTSLDEEHTGLKINPAKALHGEQYLELYRPLQPNATLKSKVVVADVLDKKSGALIIVNITTSDEKGPVCFNQFVIFAVGSGGFGGKKHSNELKPLVPTPSRAPDVIEVEKTGKSQAALYRLAADLNPLHIDPDFAAMGGFKTPILHGLCSFGMATRHVLKHFCGNDVRKFKAIKARFSKPVIPGQTIRTEMWLDQNRVLLQCKVVETGEVLLAGAYVELHGPVTLASKSTETSQVAQPVAAASSVQSDTLFQLMSDNLPKYPHLVKKIKASFLWKITSGGKVVSEWTTDFAKEPGSVTHGKPSGKPNCTITIADEDFMRTAMGETNAQKLFMKGKVKISGNIMLAQKLQTLLKEFDLKQEMAKARETPASTPTPAPTSGNTSLKSHAIFKEMSSRLVAMPQLAKKIKASFLFNITKDGKPAGQWFIDLKTGSGSIIAGAPTRKPDCTITVSDDDFGKITSGKANAQQLFMGGKLKVGGNVMLTQKLGDLLKSQAKL